MDTNNQSMMAPIVQSVAQGLLVERGINLGSKLLQGKKVDDKDLFTLGAAFIVYLIAQSK